MPRSQVRCRFNAAAAPARTNLDDPAFSAFNSLVEVTALSTDPNDGSVNHDGAEPVYGPAYGAVHTGATQAGTPAGQPGSPLTGGPSQPYTATYPPYPSDVPAAGGISAPVASGLAYFTVIPAVIFLLLEPYRYQPLVRFHSWQSIFYFLAVAAIRVVEMLLVAMLPSSLAFSISSLLSLVLLIGWLIAVIKAFQGSRWLLPVIGSYASQTASTVSTR